jgi:hypothetical protein
MSETLESSPNVERSERPFGSRPNLLFRAASLDYLPAVTRSLALSCSGSAGLLRLQTDGPAGPPAKSQRVRTNYRAIDKQLDINSAAPQLAGNHVCGAFRLWAPLGVGLGPSPVAPLGMSALGQKRSFAPDPPNVRFGSGGAIPPRSAQFLLCAKSGHTSPTLPAARPLLWVKSRTRSGIGYRIVLSWAFEYLSQSNLKHDVAYCDPGVAVPAIEFRRGRFVDHFPILMEYAHKFAWFGIPALAKCSQNVGSDVADGERRLGAFQQIFASEPNVSVIRFINCQSFEN